MSFREIRTHERMSEQDRKVEQIVREHDRLFLRAADCFMFTRDGNVNPKWEEAWEAVKQFEEQHPEIFMVRNNDIDPDKLAFPTGV